MPEKISKLKKQLKMSKKIEELVNLLEADDKAAEHHVLTEHLKVLGKRRRFFEELENETKAKIQKLGPEVIQSPFGAYRDDPHDSQVVQPEHDDQKQAASQELLEEARILIHRALASATPGQTFFVPESYTGDYVRMVPYKLLEAPDSRNEYQLSRKDEAPKLKKLVFGEDDYEDVNAAAAAMEKYLLPVDLPVPDVRKLYKYMFPDVTMIYVD